MKAAVYYSNTDLRIEDMPIPEIKKGEMPRFVTASLKVDYLAPTPINTELELRGKIKWEGDLDEMRRD